MAIDWSILYGSLNSTFLGNSLLDYLLFFGIIAASIVLGKVLYFILAKFVKVFAKSTKTKLDDVIVESIDHPIVFLVFIIGFFISYKMLVLSPSAEEVFTNIVKILMIINVAWLGVRFIDAAIKYYIKPLTSKTETDLDDTLMPILRKLSKGIVIALAFVMIIDRFGYDVTSLIAGLGIGGLAFALAAKDMLSNMFGGVSIVTDKPFKIGDWISIGGKDGTVKEIGLRTSRISAFDGSELIMPNSMIADSIIENVSRQKKRRSKYNIGLVYGTSNAKIKKAVKIIKDAVKKQSNTERCDVFTDDFFGDFSLNLTVQYWITDMKKRRKIISDINMDIKVKFEKEGIDMAFPTQTIELIEK